MAEGQLDPELKEALEELQHYLSDVLPPLVVADAFLLLLKYPPQLVASHINAWTLAQFRGGAPVPISDYLFHAVKKIRLMGEFHLVPWEPFEKYFEELKIQVLNYCPEGDREFLKVNLDQLSEAALSLTSPVEVLFRQKSSGEARPLASGGAPGVGGGTGEGLATGADLAGLRRVSIMLERLEQEIQRGTDQQGALKGAPLASQTLAAVARSSQNSRELDQVLERLRELGLDVGTSDVLRSLGNSLPGWVAPLSADRRPGDPPAPTSPTIEAMRRLVTETEDPAEGARRFNEMVKSAVERFNEGSLAQAVTMLELAERIIAERRVDSVAADAVRRKADEGVDVERLRKYSEVPDQHPLLRRFLTFFPSLRPEGLFASLRGELKRERRRLLLALLEAHGLSAREAALERLHLSFGQGDGDEDWYLRRNLLYLLRRIPRPAGDSLDQDVDVAVRHSELRLPAPLVKEAIANLGQLKHNRAEATLLGMLEDLETMLSKPGAAPYEPLEMRLMLDRVVAALARFGTPGARRAVVEHGVKVKKELGDTMSRLAELGGQDLSKDDDLVERLLAMLKANAPFKLFGLVLRQNDRNLYHCVEALSATPHPAVQQAFRDIVKRFSGERVAQAAAKALAAFQAASAAAAPASTETTVGSLSGDLELFGLPGLMQSLAESRVSGSLTLREPKGEFFGAITLRGGKLAGCQTGLLTDEEAYYQLLERPIPGNFLFLRQPESPSEEAVTLREVLPLTLEGMRRYDEFQQAAGLVPDDAVLKATDLPPTPPSDERDGILFKDLWTRVARSATPLQCEADVRADSYRIRRLLAHWVEQGALTRG